MIATVQMTDYNIFDGNKLRIPQLAEFILAKHADHDFTLIIDQSAQRAEIYENVDRVYKPSGENTLKYLIKYYLEEKSCDKYVREVLNDIKITLAYEGITRDAFEPPACFINFKNGVYDLDNDEFTPKEYMTNINKFLNRIATSYVPGAKCPKFDKFLKQIFKTNPEQIPTIWEIIGYTFYRKYSFPKLIIFYGNGQNGKTTLQNIIQSVVGDENCSSESLDDITAHPWSRAELYAKYTNIAGELQYSDLKDTSKMKKLLGKDWISVARKFKDPFKFKNYATMIVNTNRIVLTWDTTTAFYTRILLIEFRETFLKEANNADTNKDEEILNSQDEREGIVQKALEGLKRLIENKGFSTELSPADMGEKYEYLTDYVGSWITENVRFSNTQNTGQRILYKKYFKECASLNIIPETLISFGRAMQRVNREGRIFTQIDKKWKREKGKKQHKIVYKGCEYKE